MKVGVSRNSSSSGTILTALTLSCLSSCCMKDRMVIDRKIQLVNISQISLFIYTRWALAIPPKFMMSNLRGILNGFPLHVKFPFPFTWRGSSCSLSRTYAAMYPSPSSSTYPSSALCSYVCARPPCPGWSSQPLTVTLQILLMPPHFHYHHYDCQ